MIGRLLIISALTFAVLELQGCHIFDDLFITVPGAPRQPDGRIEDPSDGSNQGNIPGNITEMWKRTSDLHNVYRCIHGLNNLQWDSQIARNAQEHANKGRFEHSSPSSRFLFGQQCGENLAEGTILDGPESSRLWYAEIRHTSPWGTATDPSNGTGVIGHYTQVVWKETTMIGCGIARSIDQDSNLIVCQYCVSGNLINAFVQNVLPPVRSATQCCGRTSDVPPGNWPSGTDPGVGPLDPSTCPSSR